MQHPIIAALLRSSFVAFSCPAFAASLQISPVSIEIPAPGAAATVSLRNESVKPLSAQVRVFRWTQVNGEEKLEPTNDVVSSPPTVLLAPRANYALRVVRTLKSAVAAPEAYRLLIDELPDPNRQKSGAVTLVLRYSVPVFFDSADISAPKIDWSVEKRGSRVVVIARNSGERHLRIAAMKVRDSNGTVVSFGAGLTGYVLARSTMQWTAAGRSSGFNPGGSAVITALSDLGPIDATAPVKR